MTRNVYLGVHNVLGGGGGGFAQTEKILPLLWSDSSYVTSWPSLISECVTLTSMLRCNYLNATYFCADYNPILSQQIWTSRAFRSLSFCLIYALEPVEHVKLATDHHCNVCRGIHWSRSIHRGPVDRTYRRNRSSFQTHLGIHIVRCTRHQTRTPHMLQHSHLPTLCFLDFRLFQFFPPNHSTKYKHGKGTSRPRQLRFCTC